MDFRAGRCADGSRDPSTILQSDVASAPAIKTGDMVVFLEGREAIGFDRMKDKGIWQCSHGAFHHEDMLGKQFGSRVFSRTARGFVYALSPTPELWSQVVPNRTQIVQDFDQSIVIFRLDMKPGDVVVESGTGSGVMSSSIMRTIAPNGFLHTFEFNEIRATTAGEEFAENRLGELTNVVHRDVCATREEGGGFGDELDGKADAVFLDLPEPWLAVAHARLALKPGKKVCSYSPCIEQVMKTCEALRTEGFHSVTTIEFRRRSIGHMEVNFEVPDFGYSIRASAQSSPKATSTSAWSGQAASLKVESAEKGDLAANGEDSVEARLSTSRDGEGEAGVREAGLPAAVRLEIDAQSESDKAFKGDGITGNNATGGETESAISKSESGQDSTTRIGKGQAVGGAAASAASDKSMTIPSKRLREESESSQQKSNGNARSADGVVRATSSDRRKPPPRAAGMDESKPSLQLVCAQPHPIMRGHTAFLTFATKPVLRETAELESSCRVNVASSEVVKTDRDDATVGESAASTGGVMTSSDAKSQPVSRNIGGSWNGMNVVVSEAQGTEQRHGGNCNFEEAGNGGVRNNSVHLGLDECGDDVAG